MAEWEVTLSTNSIIPEADVNNLKREVPTPFPDYAITLPRYAKLNDQYHNVDKIDTGNIGYVSGFISGADGTFDTPPEITISYARRKTCKGIKIQFNAHSGDYCSHIKIEWMLRSSVVHTEEFHPDAPEYFCIADVTLFNSIRITFLRTSKPYRRVFVSYLEAYRLLQGAGLVIDYYDIAYGAKEKSAVTTDDAAAYADPSMLLANSIDPYEAYAPCLPRYSKLDGQWVNAPDDLSGMHYTSEQISGADGTFADPPAVTVTCSETLSSIGLELFFNSANGDYCSKIHVAWYKDTTLLHEADFEPTGVDYFVNYKCQNYNKIVLTFTKTSKPYRYAVLTGFYFGLKRTFKNQQITKATTYLEIASIGESMPMCSLNFSLRNDGLPFIFEKSQDLLVSYDNQPIGHYYLTSGERTSELMYTIKAADIKQVLEGKTHVGGFYTKANVKDVLLNEIFEGIETTVVIDDSIAAKTITGWLPYSNRRDNLSQICYAIGAIVDTSFDDGVFIYAYDSTLDPKKITNADVYSNTVKIKTGDPITGVEVTAHAWVKENDDTEIYNGAVSGTLTVIFDSPMYDLSCSGGTITESGDNYAIISASGTVVLKGKQYTDVTKIYKRENPLVYRNKKLAKSDSSTLVTEANVEEVVNRMYDYYMLNQTINADILLGNIELSNIVSIDTFDGPKKGIVTALNMTYYGDVKAGVKIKCLQ